MYLNPNICKIMKQISINTAIFIAVFLFSIKADAQEYNNWLMQGAILNFDTSPANIICNENEEFVYNQTIMLSDENGKILLYGYKQGKTLSSDFVIKNKNNESIINVECLLFRNGIGCKIPQGGYYIAAVLNKSLTSNYLYLYKFDEQGNLENEYIYNNGTYSFFIDMLYFVDYVALIAYKKGQIETYKLTSEGCELWNTSEITLNEFANTPASVAIFDIEHSLDNSKIIASKFSHAYVLNFNKNNGKIDITAKYESDKLFAMSFSKNDKYFLIIDNGKLKGYKYSNNFDFNINSTPDIVYDLHPEKENTSNNLWDMAIGVDGKIYIHYHDDKSITVLDGIEDGNITEEKITSECLSATKFPNIPRKYKNYDCQTSTKFDNTFVCYNQPLKIISQGTPPFEISYTIDNKQHIIKTSENEYQLPNIPGKYKITKIKDANCETIPEEYNISEIAKEIANPIKIIKD